jgi:hypothetical protein
MSEEWTADDTAYRPGGLSQPEQEPVAWMHPTSRDCVSTQSYSYKDAIPLYTAPPQREWQGLTTAERKALWNVTKKPSEFAEMVEAKLKEKNEWTCKN